MSLSSLFCWVPRGQGQGDPTRHMVAIYHGCLPVFSSGATDRHDDALPFDEVLDWGRFSVRVPTGQLGDLPAVLWPIARDAARLRAMQRELACAWRALFWTSLVGSCFGENVLGDAARSGCPSARQPPTAREAHLLCSGRPSGPREERPRLLGAEERLQRRPGAPPSVSDFAAIWPFRRRLRHAHGRAPAPCAAAPRVGCTTRAVLCRRAATAPRPPRRGLVTQPRARSECRAPQAWTIYIGVSRWQLTT